MKKLFTNDIFFAIVTWFAVIAAIPYAIVVSIYYHDNILWFANSIRIITSACLAVAYISYKKHSKNVMKGMMGAILFGIILIPLASVFLYPEYLAFSLFTVALTLTLFINHFVINSDHHSSPVAICINQCVAILFAVITFAYGILLVPSCVSLADTIVQIISIVAMPCTLFSIICIESRLDAYRKNREVAGWTQETGYPEGYVHEYQKNK